MSENVRDREVFLSYKCQKDYIERLITDEREYQLLVEGYKVDCQFLRVQIRDICFYQFLNYRGKNSNINKPSDMWAVTDEELDKKYGTEQKKMTKKQKQAEEKGWNEFFGINE